MGRVSRMVRIQVMKRIMDGIKFLRIEERGICISPMPWTAIGGKIHVSFYVNLANWNTTLRGDIYIQYNMSGAFRVVHSWQP